MKRRWRRKRDKTIQGKHKSCRKLNGAQSQMKDHRIFFRVWLLTNTISDNLRAGNKTITMPHYQWYGMASDSTRTTLSISRETRIKLSKLRKGNQTYDSLISEMADQALQVSEDDENWDVEKVLNHLKVVDKRGRYHSIDEVFPDVWDCIQWRSTEIHLNRYKERKSTDQKDNSFMPQHISSHHI